MSRRTEMLFQQHTLAIENDKFMQFLHAYFSQEDISLMVDINSGFWKNITTLYDLWYDSIQPHNNDVNNLYNELYSIMADLQQESIC
jgi:hypothetical protein